jgi:uncharacterized protein (DUF1499 family)
MVRRRFSDEPKSRLAIWAGRIGLFSLATAALSVIIVRSNLLEVGPALTTFAAALLFAVIAVLLALTAFAVIWRDGLAGLGSAFAGLLIGIGLLTYPGVLALRAYQLPAVNDVTTDTANPPRFDLTARLRPPGTNDYAGAAMAAKQRAAYPDIATMEVAAPPQIAFEIALALANQQKWRVVDARPPAAARREATIEAVARTPIMGFRDDVVIRIRAINNASLIDIRSASRLGLHDFGANAARVRSLIEDIDNAVNTMPADRKEAEKPPQPPPKRTPVPKR